MGKLALLGGEPVRKRPFTSWPQFDEMEVDNVRKVLESRRWFSGMMGSEPGSKVWEFEEKFAFHHRVKYAIAVANGTAALEVSLRALEIKPGDEVVVPAYTFIATASAVLQLRAIPVIVDIDPENYCMDPDKFKEAITSRTKAVIPVHFGGQIADMEQILEIARSKNLLVIEDAAHAPSAVRFGQKAGSFGDTGCFSFQQSKVMTSGEGGIITTNSKNLRNACRDLRSCGRREGYPWYEHFELGWNYRMTEFQGAILIAQLTRLPEQIVKRGKNAEYLERKIAEIPGLKHIKDRSSNTQHHSYYYFLIEYNKSEFEDVSRDLLIESLNNEGIPAEVTYIPLPYVNMFVEKKYPFKNMGCPITEDVYSKVIIIPHQVLLRSKEDMDDIVRAMMKIKENLSELKGLITKSNKKREEGGMVNRKVKGGIK